MPREVVDLPGLPERDPDSHKGTFGRVLLVAGSPGMCGAAILAVRAALRSGSGLVTAALPATLSTALSTATPEATQILLPDPNDTDLESALDQALSVERLATFDAAGIGPGLGATSSARRALELCLDRLEGPQVVDADALNLIADKPRHRR